MALYKLINIFIDILVKNMPRKKSVPVKSLESSDAKVAMGVTHQTPKFIPTITPPITNSNDKKSK